MEMKCNWCQEAIGNVACTSGGYCGKTVSLSQAMDVFKHHLILLSFKEDNLDNNVFIMNGLFKLITNANFDEKVFIDLINQTRVILQLDNITHQEFQEIHQKYVAEELDDIVSAKMLVLTGLMGISAYNSHAYHHGKKDDSIFSFVRHALQEICLQNDLNKLIELIDKTGEYGVKVMALLDDANTSAYGNPEITVVKTGVRNRPGILVSGHDLVALEQLLEQSKNAGIDIYTHCEMLPAHYYPNLKKYEHLYANYGNAWWQQKEEFTKFNGPILFTTNCIVPPSKENNYADKTFTIDNAGSDVFTHILNTDGKFDFTQIIELAKTCDAPLALEDATIIGGFAHNQVLELADKIVENINDGSIEKFVVMAGCDGRHKSRTYYTEYAENLSEKAIILTAGCAKFRYNKLDLKDINGIPRVLDAGQCNDSYSLVVIALKLAEVFNVNVNDLPIEYNIAWYEQKAVIVLLALLHLGINNINIGPTLPAFLSPNVTNFIVDKYKLTNDLTM